jgi:NitT/TauT family transport system substrate-binding protein
MMRALPVNATRIATFAALLLAALAAQAADNASTEPQTVIVGAVGSASTNLWPLHIGIAKGFFTAEGLAIDLVYAQSNTAVVQQLAAGSVNVSVATGLVDPIRAIDKGAPVAIARIEVDAPPYALLAKPAITSIAALRGKTISVGGAKDITRIFLERMLAPNGVSPGAFDMVFAGATSARFSALQVGAVDAALLTSPFSFHAQAAGFTNLGLTTQYVRDLPFSGTIVNRIWAAANAPEAEKFLAALTRSIAWFQDPQNREEAVAIMVRVSGLSADDVEKSYDFLHDGAFFEPTGTLSRARLTNLVKALHDLGDIGGSGDVEHLLAPGLTQVSD